jgi:hypothetical protein
MIVSLAPILPARDLDEAEAFYSKLGFGVLARQGDEYGILAREGWELHLWLCGDTHVAQNTSCYVRVRDAAALFREFSRAGIERLTAPEMKPWGMV